MMDIGFGEVAVIVVAGLLLFGPQKIPEFAKQCGRALSMFKQGLREGLDESSAKKSEPAPSSSEKQA